MKLYFLYNPVDCRVASYSKGLNQVSDKFGQLELDVTEEQMKLIEQNYWLFIKDGKLVIEKPAHIIDQEKGKQIETAKMNLKAKLSDNKTTFEDIKPLLSLIL